VRNKGGQAIDIFKHLSQHYETDFKKIWANKVSIGLKNFRKCLTKFGAGLVTKFHVDDNFRDSDNFSFTGSVDIDTTKTTGHAMVLVGVREDKLGQGWFLLQNWWEGKQFVEMTLEYLKSSNALLYFPLQKHTKVRDPLDASATTCIFTEEDFNDGGDDKEEDDYADEDASGA
jgi:hypothetical protein